MTEKLTFKGLWYLPENPNRQIFGTLSYDPNEKSYLDLMGTLVDLTSSKDHHEPLFILGISTDNKAITLYKNYQSSSSFLSNIDTSKYAVNFILVGDHYEKESEFNFDTLKCNFHNLDEWISEFGFKDVKRDSINHTLNLSYQLPKSVDFKITESLKGILSFSYTAPFNAHRSNYNIQQKATVIFRSESLCSFFDILDNLTLFQNFLTLGTFEPSYATNVILSNKNRKNTEDEDAIVNSVNLYYTSRFAYPTTKSKILWEFLFNYKEIANNFEIIIQKWFVQKDKINPVTSLLFESFYQREKFTENNFLNIVRALETFHRRFRKNEMMEKARHKEMINNILQTTNIAHKDWLQERLNFSNEPSLHSRLFELMNEANVKTIIKIITDKEQLIKDTKNNRNYYTHYDHSLENKALKGIDLWNLTEKLRALLIAIVLLETGFTIEQLDILFERNEYQFFNHIVSDK